MSLGRKGTTVEPPLQDVLSSDYSLEVYIAYKDLPSYQLASLISSITEVNRVVLESCFDFWSAELFIDSIETSSPIKIRFRQGRRLLPTIRFPKDELEIGLPRWTAALFVTGGLLIAGAEVLEAGNTIYEYVNPDKEQQEVIRETFDLEQLADAETSLGQRLRRNYFAFENEISSPNIKKWRVDVLATQGDEDEESEE